MESSHSPILVIIMGVSGSGKTTCAQSLVGAFDRESPAIIEADDFHTPENVEKMRRGEALTDADRRPWLEQLGQAARERREAGLDAIMTCSALRRVYRKQLVSAARGTDAASHPTLLVYLDIDASEALRRVTSRASRSEHFMPATLVRSQFAILEPPTEDECRELECLLLRLDATAPPNQWDEQVRAVLQGI